MRRLSPVGSPDPSRAFRFGRMFAPTRFPSNEAALRELGETIKGGRSENSCIPAGFIYLGQFVAHDISYDKTQGIHSGFLYPDEIQNGRSPALDLDSMYGRGPRFSPALYEVDRLRLRLGMTTGRKKHGVLECLPYDLPRRLASSPRHLRQALIGDPRNDDNLAVAQTHVAFLHFHNTVVERLRSRGVNRASCFIEARKTVIQHYQWIVLHDLVRKITDCQVFSDVLIHGRKCFFPRGIPRGTPLYMPLEFSGAAYRLHSMVRNEYEWNKVFNSQLPTGPMKLSNLYEFSKGHGNLGGEKTLPSDAIVDWRRLYEFEDPTLVHFARCIAPNLVDTFSDLPLRRIAPNPLHELSNLPQGSDAIADQSRSFAVRDLLRGRSYRLPTGQEVVQAMEVKGIEVTALTQEEIAKGEQENCMQKNHLNRWTPLWYYIMKEAWEQQSGQRLGKVGSRIVVETFHGLIEGSSHSILKQPGWQPTLDGCFTMVGLLKCAGVVNPLKD